MANILVMEDDGDQAELLCAILSRRGHAVKLAHSGNEAWLLLKAMPFEILVTDIYVPKAPETEGITGGISLIGKIRNATSTTENYETISKLRIVAITGGGELPQGHDPLDLAKRFGADICLRKPIDIATLTSHIGELTI